jgi:hypothetical protein
LEAFIDRLLQKDPADRIQSAAEIANLLKGYLAHLSQPLQVAAPSLPVRRTKRLLPLLVGASVALLVLPALWLLRGVLFPGPLPSGSKVLINPEKQAAGKEFRYDFRGARPPDPNFQWMGSLESAEIKLEEGGLRITVPANRGKWIHVGLELAAPLKGNFEIKAGYELIQADQPTSGYGVGFELCVHLDTPVQDQLGVLRVKRVGDGDVYLVNRGFRGENGKNQYKKQSFPTTAQSGRLLLTRRGKDATAWAADGAAGPFQELSQQELGTGDVKMIWLAAYTGLSPHGVDVRLVDLTVRSELSSEDPVFVPDPLATQAREGKRWVLTGGLLGLGLVGAILGAVWVVRRRRRLATVPISPPPTSKHRGWLLGLLLLAGPIYACALYANLSFLVTDRADYRYFPPFQPNVNHNNNRLLGSEYFHIGKALAAGEGFANPFGRPTGPTAWMPPLLPALWAGLLWLTDGNRDAVMVVAILLQVHVLIGTGLLVLALARTTTRRLGTILVAAIYFGALLVHFRFCFQVTGDPWLVLLALDLLLAGFCWYRPLGSIWPACGWGLVGGFCALVSPAVAFTWATLTLLLGWRQRALSRSLVALLGAALVLAPWTMRNYLVFGRLVPVKSNLAYEMYQSQCLQPDGLLQRATYNFHPGRANQEGEQYTELGEVAYLDLKRKQFWESVCAGPEDFLDRVAARFLGATVWYVPFNRQEPLGPWMLLTFRLTHPLPFLALLVLGFTAIRDPLSWPQRFVIGIYLLYLLPYITASYYERYAFPLLAVKVLLVVWAVDRLLALVLLASSAAAAGRS